MIRDLAVIADEMETLTQYDNPKTALVIAAGLLAEALAQVAPDNTQVKSMLTVYQQLDNGRVVK